MASISKTAQGRWKARYRSPDGQSRSRTFVTKADARRFLDRVGADMQQGRWVDPSLGRMLLSEWADIFLETATELDPNTRFTYRRDLTRNILPRFGSRALSAIRPVDIRLWLADELKAGIAPSSVHRHYRVLRRVLNVAVATELLQRSPCDGVKAPAVPATEMRFLTAADVTRLAEAITPAFRALVYTAAYTGLRWGELTGLRRGRLDLSTRTLYVVEQIVRVDGQWLRKAPKTKAGRRRVGLPAGVADLLAEHMAMYSGPGEDALVFPNRAGNPIHPSIFNTAHWKPAKAQVGLDGLRFHDLRHTAVALAIAQGAHPKAIQARMGHSSVQVTLDRYGHLFPELDADIADGLDKAFRASLILLPGGRSDTPEDTTRTQRTQKGHEKGGSGGVQTSVRGTPKSAPDLDFCIEAARRIELLYRALQALA